MYNNQAAYMYPQQRQMQMQQQQQMQMMQQRQQMQQQRMQQQQMMYQQHQQQILQARKKQVQDKQSQRTRANDNDESDNDDDDDDDDDDEDDDAESFSSLSELLSSSESESETESEAGSAAADKDRVTFESPQKSRSKAKTDSSSKSKSKSKSITKEPSKASSKAKSKATKTKGKDDEKAATEAAVTAEAHDTADAEARTDTTADEMTREMEKLAMTNVASARIPSSAVSPAEYMYNVIADVLKTNNKKNFQRILARTPLPIALTYLHQIAQKAFATGNKEIHKVVIDTNNKYNIISDLYIDALASGNSKSVSNAMTYLDKTLQAFAAGAQVNIEELLKFFTPEFIAMNLIRAGNIEAYDKIMAEFKNEEIRISRGFHVAKPLLAAYFGVPAFFSNQKRYTFNRDIIVLAICGGNTETVDYVVKKTKMGKISHDIVLEARSCQPIPAHMMKHLVDKYNVSEMSL
jgi:chemotaxis protein histidine kinase CheA